MPSVVAIQRYLASKEGKTNWVAINCGAMPEFVLDYPVLLDFDNPTARLLDGDQGTISLSDIPLLARIVAAALFQPDRVIDHRLEIHTGIITQSRALDPVTQYSLEEWKVEQSLKKRTQKRCGRSCLEQPLNRRS